MSEGGSLINLGDLSRPATVLIEKVSNPVGVVYEPTRIRRRARAEADAEKIKALARMELTAIEERALERLVHQEARKQENIESITEQAARSLPPDAKVEKLEDDWIAHFFKQCDTVSDKEMQSLWARLLAGEASYPGTYSKRTVDFISTIDKKDAALFTIFAQFVWMFSEPTPLVYRVEDDVYKVAGVTFTALKHLDAIGLISFEATGGYAQTGFGKYGVAHYYGRKILLEFRSDKDNQLKAGHTLLTSVGKELVPICGSLPNEPFFEYTLRQWQQQGLVLSSFWPRPKKT